MNKYLLKRIASCAAGLFFVIPLANAQGMGVTNPSAKQVEAIEGHLQQSRTQASKESDGSAKKKPKTYELPPAASNTQMPKQKKSDKEAEKQKELSASSMKNQ